MTNGKLRLALLLALLTVSFLGNAQEKYTPLFKVATLQTSMDAAINDVKSSLEESNFKIIGEYHPGNKSNLYVIAFTNDELQSIALQVKDRGALAIAQKVGLVKKGNDIIVSLLNPEYMFYAYFMEGSSKHEHKIKAISKDIESALKKVGSDFTPFGGEQSKDDLFGYHYMAFMPYFTDPVELNEFSSFDEGLRIIRSNLIAKKGNTVKVYEIVFKDKEIAVFGIGLLDPEEGEVDFLPTIGEDHIAAMPYEIILQGKEATMLHGKYRFALYWPELSMSTFMKIVSTPGDVEDFMEGLTE